MHVCVFNSHKVKSDIKFPESFKLSFHLYSFLSLLLFLVNKNKGHKQSKNLTFVGSWVEEVISSRNKGMLVVA
jgi:hypothetical protein